MSTAKRNIYFDLSSPCSVMTRAQTEDAAVSDRDAFVATFTPQCTLVTREHGVESLSTEYCSQRSDGSLQGRHLVQPVPGSRELGMVSETYDESSSPCSPSQAATEQCEESMSLASVNDSYADDISETLQDITEHGLFADDSQASPMYIPEPKDAAEATKLLSTFRPAKGNVSDLQKLLDARADPNTCSRSGEEPLRKVIATATSEKVQAMRAALLRAGARASDDAIAAWHLRSAADANEQAWLERYHRTPGDLI